MPGEDEVGELGSSWCDDPEAALEELLEALEAGGDPARRAVAALVLHPCPADQAERGGMQAVFDALTAAPQLQAPESVLRWVDAGAAGACHWQCSRSSLAPPWCNASHLHHAHSPRPLPFPACRYVVPFVRAADDIGAGACVTVVVLDASSGAVAAARRIHTGGGAVVEVLVPPPGSAGSSGGSGSGSVGALGGPPLSGLAAFQKLQ